MWELKHCQSLQHHRNSVFFPCFRWFKNHNFQRAITLGQICTFYENGVLLGGGVFESITL
ncbi:MAG: aminomethyltransferase beta-barrel domain-containing protein [Akkermansiaceae bacterium]